MEIPEVNLSSKDIRIILNDLINEFVRVEKKVAEKYQYQSNYLYLMAQINMLTSFIGEKWDSSKQSYYEYLKYIVKKYELTVWCIDDLFDHKQNCAVH